MKNDPYFELLEIIKAQDQLEKLSERLALVAGRLAKKLDAEIKTKITVLSPSDRPYETFEAQDENN